ncbi:MAG: bifunctional DNA-formamidopyrimidine glycosylase/DNA-(apurinic or apyrimidinic site) lyase [Myxococcales bacterium]|nr:MAG: bifunctional DNA-formamidopyrimidine glycosylase/DNA-(apurinic or apyrimidinic site) lyase [Myxococcales bacterium]
MPELPEVETVRRSLGPLVVGRQIVEVDVRRRDLRWNITDTFESTLQGRRIVSAGRRAKYLLFGLEDGNCWIVHLGMSGTLCHVGTGAGAVTTSHEHVVLMLEDGNRVVYRDPRRFGFMLVVEEPSACDHLVGLGPEPLDEDVFSGAYLAGMRRGTRRAVKNVLMDQCVVAGLGNIYVNEILFVAGIRPTRAFRRLSRRDCDVVADATREVLNEAIAHRGTSMHDFLDGIGEKGGYQWRRLVYDREGQPCPNCATPVRACSVGQRSTFYCPRCQK